MGRFMLSFRIICFFAPNACEHKVNIHIKLRKELEVLEFWHVTNRRQTIWWLFNMYPYMSFIPLMFYWILANRASPVVRDGAACLQADLIPGAALTEAARRKRRYAYPELHNAARCRMVIIALEVGRWSEEAAGQRTSCAAQPRRVPAGSSTLLRSPLGWHRLRCRPAGAGQQPAWAAGQRGWRRWWGTWFPHRPRRGELGRAPLKSLSETLHDHAIVALD